MSAKLSVRTSSQVYVANGPPAFENFNDFLPVVGKGSKCMKFDPTGKYFCFNAELSIRIHSTEDWKEVYAINTKAYQFSFSPNGNCLCTWNPFTISKAYPDGEPNFKIYCIESRSLIAELTQKTQTTWEPQWSYDEKICSYMVNNKIFFYENCDFSDAKHRLVGQKFGSYSFSSRSQCVLAFVSGTKSQPSKVILYKYPDFDESKAIASRCFYQADRVQYHWNKPGKFAVVVSLADVDATGKNYYGKQGLYFFDIGGKSNIITLAKEGPIYAVSWSPRSDNFCVLYGSTPAKGTLFNTKCDPIFEFGTGPRNALYYNPFGNILIIGGFGNIRGNIEMWDMRDKKLIAKYEAADTTLLEWCPDGVHFMTATTSPRLRIDNCYKVWHYSGSVLHEQKIETPEELYDVRWESVALSNFTEPVIDKTKISSSQATPAAARQAYVPPSMRNRLGIVKTNIHEEEDASVNVVSKNAMRQRKKREAKKAQKPDEIGENINVVNVTSHPAKTSDIELTGDPEKDKKIKNIKKKLDAIAVLKAQKSSGKPLEINQVQKIKSENELLEELNKLTC